LRMNPSGPSSWRMTSSGAFGFQIDVIADHERNVEAGIVLLDLFAKFKCGVMRFVGVNDHEIAVELYGDVARLLDAIDDLDDVATPLQNPTSRLGEKGIRLNEHNNFVAGGHSWILAHLLLGKWRWTRKSRVEGPPI
jgi:hypothetical protein